MFKISNDWDNKNFVLQQVQENGMKLQYASPRLKKDFDVVTEAVKQKVKAIRHSDPKLYNDINFYKYFFLIKSSLFYLDDGDKKESLSIFNPIILDNHEIMKKILLDRDTPHGWIQFVIPLIGSKLKKDITFWKDILSSTTYESDYNNIFISSPLYENRELTIFYLLKGKQKDFYLWHPNDKFKNDQEIITLLFNSNKWMALDWMSEKLKDNVDFMYYLWNSDKFLPAVLEDVSDTISEKLKEIYKKEFGMDWDNPKDRVKEKQQQEDTVNYEEEEEQPEEEEEEEEQQDYGEVEYEDDYYGEEGGYHRPSHGNAHKSTKKTDFSYLFKNNIHKLAISLYKGQKATVVSLFKLYSYIVDIRSNDIEEANLFRGKTLPLWKAVLKEQSKQFTPNEKVTATITQSLQVIDAYFKKNTQPLDSPSLQQEKVTLYKASRYKTLIVNLLQYMISFFGHMGIKVKPLQIVSHVSNIKVIGLMADTVGEAPAVSQMASQVSAIKDKLTQNLLRSSGYNSIEDFVSKVPKKKIKGIEYYEVGTFNKKFLSLDTLKSYDTLELLLADVKKEKIIDKNYSQLQVSEGKVILPSKNKVVKTITYLTPEELRAKIKEYQTKIDTYNSKLQSYEKKLSNDPKTIKLGDHQVNTVKILDRNISRLVVVDGHYQGHFVDELVSSTGEVIWSVGKASASLTETSKVLKTINKSQIESVFREPIEFSNLKKISDYESPKNLNTVLDDNYLDVVNEEVSIDVTNFHNIVGNNILFNMGNEVSKIKSQVKVFSTSTGYIVKNSTSLPDSYGGADIQIDRELSFDYGEPNIISNNLFTSSACIPDGIGTRIFTQQVKSASEEGFKYIKTYAAKGGQYMGYYIWPKMGYDARVSIDLYYVQRYKLEPLYNYLKNWLEKNSKSAHITRDQISCSILDIYACKAKDRFIGQELWKQFGDSTSMVFDLYPNSLSLRILEAYVSLKAKKEGLDPKDYLNVDYSRFANYSLDCLLKRFSEKSYFSSNYEELKRRLQDSVRNYENGEIFRIYRNPNTRYLLISALSRINDPKLNESISLILKQKGYENVKFASDNQISEDPMIREIDESIVKQVWDGINKLYEAGTFK